MKLNTHRLTLICLIAIACSCDGSDKKHHSQQEEPARSALEIEINEKHDELMAQMTEINERTGKLIDIADSLQISNITQTTADSLQIAALLDSLAASSKSMFGWMRNYSKAIDSSWSTAAAKKAYYQTQIEALDKMQIQFLKTFELVDKKLEDY